MGDFRSISINMASLGYSEEEEIPPDWTISYEKGKKVYITPPPKCIKIDCTSRLNYYQAKGLFLEMDVKKLQFGKRKKKTQLFKNHEEDFNAQADDSMDFQDAVLDNDAINDGVVNDVEYCSSEVNLIQGSSPKPMSKIEKEKLFLNRTVRNLSKDQNISSL